jgi:phenylpropionate dioxygenase-like ring-hydroxylating dioxygenase large terminal subunit
MLLSEFPHLKKQWFAICSTLELGKKVLSRRLFGIPIVLFRDAEGHPAALIDRCPHRSMALSQGCVQEGILRCVYHGWGFNGNGICIDIPALPKSNIYSNQHAKSVSVKEENAVVFVNLTNAKSIIDPILNRAFLFPDQTSFASFIWTLAIPCTLLEAIENTLDPTHTHFVHAGIVRTHDFRRPVQITVKKIQSGFEAIYNDEGRQKGIIQKYFGANLQKGIGRFLMPATAELEYRDQLGLKALFRIHFTPVDEKRTSATVIGAFRTGWIPSSMAKLIFLPFLRKVLDQDINILRKQQENINRFPNEKIAYTAADFVRPYIIQAWKNPENFFSQNNNHVLKEVELAL